MLNITDASKRLFQCLLNSQQNILKNSLFWDDLFEKTCWKIQDRNKTWVICSIILNIVFSVKNLNTYDATHLEHLIEAVNEDWMNSIAVKGLKLQLNYSVEFRQFTFSDKQLNKLNSLINSIYDIFFFIAIYQMYFLFLTCKVKYSATALDITDWQNVHSMIFVIRDVVELYRAVKQKKKLHWEILVFLISHDHSSVRIYSHYAIIKKDKIIFYHHSIHKFDFTTLDSKEKWMTYKFIKNVYNIWMSLHLKRICSVINELLSDINFNLSQAASFSQSEPQSSQQLNVKYT